MTVCSPRRPLADARANARGALGSISVARRHFPASRRARAIHRRGFAAPTARLAARPRSSLQERCARTRPPPRPSTARGDETHWPSAAPQSLRSRRRRLLSSVRSIASTPAARKPPRCSRAHANTRQPRCGSIERDASGRRLAADRQRSQLGAFAFSAADTGDAARSLLQGRASLLFACWSSAQH